MSGTTPRYTSQSLDPRDSSGIPKVPFDTAISIKEPGRWRLARAIGLMALTGLLLWPLVMRGVAFYLALEAPETALRLRSTEPTALISLADQRLNLKQAKPGNAETNAEALAVDARAEAAEQTHDRLGGWAELALKAAANRLPLNTAPRAKDAIITPKSEASPLSGRDRSQIRAMAELALFYDPLNARALRILGQLADAAGDEARAAKLMQAAARRSLGESAAVYWLMRRSVEKQDYTRAVEYADIFLRKRPQLIAFVMPLLGKLAQSQDQAAHAALTRALRANPPWRGQFFAELPKSTSDVRVALEFLLGVKDTPTPPTTTDLNAYLSFLLANKFYELAYYTWLQFLPPHDLSRIGFLSNGSFETVPSGLPFDWVITPGSGVTIDMVPRPEGGDQHALFLEFGPGRVDFRGVSQTLMLAPGAYRLRGKYKGDLVGTRGLQWQIKCIGTTRPAIGEGPMFLGSAPIWTSFDFTFTVPPSDCQAQEVRLEHTARSASEQLLSGTVWYDELDLTRADIAKP
jgi:hypothetical protein